MFSVDILHFSCKVNVWTRCLSHGWPVSSFGKELASQLWGRCSIEQGT